MPRKATAKVITANALLEGDVVYFTAQNTWSRHHHQAELLTDADTAATRLAAAETQASEIVGAYLADAQAGANGPEPIHFRERFRTRGPSNYAHGKQASA